MARHLAYLDLRVAAPDRAGAPDLAIPYAAAATGGEPIPAWIEAYEQVTVAVNGVSPPGLAPTFVLQHLLDPLATVLATAAVRTDRRLDAAPEHWSLGLEPTYRYPVVVQVRADAVHRHDVGTTDEGRVAAAREAYLATARRIARTHPAPGRMSSRQRLGMVEDLWEMALARLAGDPPPDRRSCCLIYALPGCSECAGCPRASA